MNTTARFAFWRHLFAAFAGALQWRVLLLWLLALGAAALVAVFPFWQALDGALSRSVDAARYASGLDAVALADLGRMFGKDGGIGVGVLAGGLLSLLLSPWLTGVMLAGIRGGRTARLGALAGDGMREYGRQLRLMIWAIVPLGIAIGLGAWWFDLADTHAEQAVLAASAKHGHRLALAGALLALLLAHAGIELTRARIAVRDDTRSVIRAWWRSLKLFLRRPWAVLGLYLLACVIGFAVVLALAWLRTRVAGIGWGSFALALLCTQAVVAALAWVRLARLRALAALVDDDAARRAAAA